MREQVATDMRDIVKDYPEIGYTTLEQWHQNGRVETKKDSPAGTQISGEDWGRTRF